MENLNNNNDTFDYESCDSKDLLKRFLLEMDKAKATGEMVVEFDGYGDSGDMHEPILTEQQQKAMESLGWGFGYCQRQWDNEKKVWKSGKLGLLDVVRDIIDYDWINNEGGFGRVILDIDDQTVRVECSLRCTNTEDYTEEF